MAKLDRAQEAALKNLVTEERWDLLKLIMNKRISQLYREPITGGNEFQTLRELHIREGKIHGILEFFDSIENGTFNNE